MASILKIERPRHPLLGIILAGVLLVASMALSAMRDAPYGIWIVLSAIFASAACTALGNSRSTLEATGSYEADGLVVANLTLGRSSVRAGWLLEASDQCLAVLALKGCYPVMDSAVITIRGGSREEAIRILECVGQDAGTAKRLRRQANAREQTVGISLALMAAVGLGLGLRYFGAPGSTAFEVSLLPTIVLAMAPRWLVVSSEGLELSSFYGKHTFVSYSEVASAGVSSDTSGESSVELVLKDGSTRRLGRCEMDAQLLASLIEACRAGAVRSYRESP